MTALDLPPEIEAGVRVIAEETHRDMQAVLVELIRDGLRAAQKRAFDRELLENYEAIKRGEYVTEEESIASTRAIERGE